MTAFSFTDGKLPLKKMRQKFLTPLARVVALLLVALVLVAAPLPAQPQRRKPTHRRARHVAAKVPAHVKTTPARTASPATKPAPSPSGAATATGITAPVKTGTRNQAAPTPLADKDITFDNLLSSDAYALYVEVRAVGQQVQPGGLLEMLEPLWQMGDAPPEIARAAIFLRAHAEMLQASRVMVVGMPADPSLPANFAAVELPSVEAARAFVPELNAFLSSVIPPTPDPTLETAHGKVNVNGNMSVDVNANMNSNMNANMSAPTLTGEPRRQRASLNAEAAKPKSAPEKPFYISRANSLVIVSAAPLKLASLRATPDKLLVNQPHFKAAHARFSAEPIFVYFDFSVMERQYKLMREAMEAQQEMARKNEQTIQDETGKMVTPPTIDADPILMPPDSPVTGDSPQESETMTEDPEEDEGATIAEPVVRVGTANTEAGNPDAPSKLTPEEQADMEAESQGSGGPEPVGLLMSSLFNFGMFAQTQWPEGLSVAIAPEGDTFAVRALLFNDAASKRSIIPFFPLLVSGPPITSEAAALMPAGTDIFIGASLDMPGIFDQFFKSMSHEREQRTAYLETERQRRGEQAKAASEPETATKEPTPEEQLAAIEKLFGFKVREDIIGSLGNEVAISVPASWFTGTPAAKAPDAPPAQTPSATATPETPATPPGPVILISLRDKATLQRVLPRAMLALGMRKVDVAGQNAKHNGVEIMNFGSGALAFVDNYLALASDAGSIRRVLDSSASGQTLASTEEFRGATRWQPRQSLGQVYVSAALLRSFFADAKATAETSTDPQLKTLLSHFNLDLGAITHAVVNEGDGPLHELHVPRNLLSMFVAEETIDAKEGPVRSNEWMAIYRLRSLHEREAAYINTKGKGSYGTLDELVAQKMVGREGLEIESYHIELSVSGKKFEATATPINYPDRGRRSFFIDETGVLRGGNKGGQRATASDEIIK